MVRGAWDDAVADLLDRSHLITVDELADAVAHAARVAGAQTRIHLVDLEQRGLRPFTRRPEPGADVLPVDDSIAGQAFRRVEMVAQPGEPGRLWVPLVDGTERLGVLEVVLARPEDAGPVAEAVFIFAGLVGHLVMTKLPYGDSLHRVRRSEPMSVASELLWRLLPPLTFACDRMVVTTVLQPCYDVGGDAFDYSVDGATARLAVLDAVGHTLQAGLAATVALAATRATRRNGGGLVSMAEAADANLSKEFPDARYVTAVLAELDLDSGHLTYISAGHPAPVLVRRHRVERTLDDGRRLPLGLADSCAQLGHEALEPGDRLLMYTDGVTEGRNEHGDPFGVERLVKLIEEHSADDQPPAETLRLVSHAVAAYQQGHLRDDATLMFVEWSAVAGRRSLP